MGPIVRLATALCAVLLLATAARAEDLIPLQTKDGDYIVRDFQFHSGEAMAELRMHYTILGTPKRDADGRVTNAVIILHGTGGSGKQFLRPQFANVLFAPGGLLDPAKYFIILPDGIGHGGSSKPSDGMHARFPHYDYDDMVGALDALVREGLGVNHARLIMGTSMGCMHAFVWGEMHPDFMDALMPLACQPVEIAGRNRMWRKMVLDAITQDPAYEGGEYSEQPKAGLRTATDLLIIAGSAPHQLQKSAPTREAADKALDESIARVGQGQDANDIVYQVAASRNYDPSPRLGEIRARVMWVNSADDFINPPELGIAEREVKKLRRAKFVLLPISDQTRGHGTHTWAVAWKGYLAELLKATER